MPFTFSHPAIVLPLMLGRRKLFSLTGLVIGSLTPDFEYFLRMKIQSNFSHTLMGMFWFDLPLGILLAFIFHNTVRNHLFVNLPTILSSRLAKFNQFDWNDYFRKNWFVVVISVLFGAGSHLFWDSFTHENGYFVQKIPAMLNKVNFFGREVPMLKVLQHLSTLAGGIAIAFALFKIEPNTHITGKANRRYWLILAMLTLSIIAVRLLSGLDYQLYGNVIVTAISAGLISLSLTPWFSGKI